MALSAGAQRAYVEARRRRVHPELSPTRKPTGKQWEVDIEVWLMAMEIADTKNITPWDALLLAVRRRAARVQWVDNVITEIIKQHIDSDGDPNIPPDEVKPWLMESRKEEQLMVRSAKLAIDAGVAEAVVRRLEMEGKVITDALVAGLDSLELTPEQRMTALSVMHNQLTGGFNGNNDDGNVIDQ